VNKLWMYYGWADGLALGTSEKSLPLVYCLEGVGAHRAIDNIDAFYRNMPESRSIPISMAIREALTNSGAPCEGKDPNKQPR
jgi:hypothetical protein